METVFLPTYVYSQPGTLLFLFFPFAQQLCPIGCDNSDRLAVICPMEDTKCWDCPGESRIKLASTFSWTLNNAGWNDTGVKTKQNNFWQFLILCLIGFFYTQGKYCQTSNPPEPCCLGDAKFQRGKQPWVEEEERSGCGLIIKWSNLWKNTATSL